MRNLKITSLLVFLILAFNQGSAQTTEPSADHKKLSGIAGRWTIQGMENKYLEVCDMYQGGYFLVCNTEYKTNSGGVSKGVSIMGYSAEGKHITYYYYSSSGETRSLKGRFDEKGDLFFEGEELVKGKLVKTRIAMNKSGEDYNFKEETSTDNEPWTTSTEFVYVRVK